MQYTKHSNATIIHIHLAKVLMDIINQTNFQRIFIWIKYKLIIKLDKSI
jgi:hypothetical protein